MPTTSVVSRLLVQPARIASLLNWHKSKTIMALNMLKPCAAYRPFPRESGEFAPLSNAAATHPDSQLTL